MFSKLAILFTATLTITVTAGGYGYGGNKTPQGVNDSCNTGDVQCCNTAYDASSAEASWVREYLGINIPVDTNVGFTCSPITAALTGNGAACSQKPLCCTENHFDGLVAVGCTPIDVSV